MPKALFLILCCVFISSGSYAQYVMEEKDHVHDYTFPKSDVYNTMRWTKKDILKGREYDVYSQMDSGFVIVHEYVMMSCRPCITAGKGLEKIVNSLRKLHPGKIKYFQTVFEDE